MSTFLELLIESLIKAADYNPDEQGAPAAVLWTDKDRQWGQVSLYVEEDSLEGAAAIAVIEDGEGRVVAKFPTTVGG